MQILVTGGAGYIGSVVTEELVRDGHQVVVYDNLAKGHREAVVAGVELVEADLIDGSTLRATLTKHQIEAVVHMAADSLVGESCADPAKYYRNNVTAGLTLLDAMRDTNIHRLVFSSTASTYGEQEQQPIVETATTSPTNPYGQTKLVFEKAMEWYDQAYGLRYVSLRYFNAAGASDHCGEWHDPETHLIPSALQAALGRRPVLEVFGEDYPTRDGTCVRDYVHVIDLARAHILALGALDKGSRIYNLGCGGEGYTVREVIETAQEVIARNIPVSIKPRRPGDPATLVASSEKIKHDLGWQPQYQDLRVIVESAWRWLLAHPNGYAGTSMHA